jgi:RNA polymerase sigma factor (sigma-70 family)
MSGLPSTSAALLERLRVRPNDQAAWSEFVNMYSPTILRWAGEHRRLSPTDCEDVTQAVLLRIFAIIPTFEYDPARSFRGLLRQITAHALADCARRLQRTERPNGLDATADLLQSEPAREDLVQRLERTYDLVVFEQACLLVRLRLNQQVWEAYRLTLPTTLGGEGLSNEETAERIDMKKVQVERAKNKVKRMLTKEVSRLTGENGSATDTPQSPAKDQE